MPQVDDGSRDEARARELIARGRSREALPFAIAAVQKRRTLVGDVHSDVERALLLLADVEAGRENLPGAIEALDQALTSRWARLGANSVESAPLLERLAYLYSRNYEGERMESAALTAVRIRVAANSREDLAVAEDLRLVGQFFLRCDDEKASRYLTRAQAVIEAHDGPHSPALAAVFIGLSTVHAHHHDGGASAALQRVVGLGPPRSASEATALVDALSTVADGLDSGLDAEVRSSAAARALQIEAQWSGPRGPRIPGLTFSLAKWLARAGRMDEASGVFPRWGVLLVTWAAPFEPAAIEVNKPGSEQPSELPPRPTPPRRCAKPNGGTVPDAQRVVAGLTAAFRQCYKDTLRTVPTFQGTVRLSAKIDASGKPGKVSGLAFGRSASMTTDELHSAVVDRLLDGNLPGWVRAALVAWKGRPRSVPEAPSETVHIEVRVFDQSYIDFLDRQIGLNPRGDEWNARLVRRRAALHSYVDTQTLCVSVSREPQRFDARLKLDGLAVIHWEYYD